MTTKRSDLPPRVTIRNSLKPGDIGRIIYLHGVLYARECGWDETFEAYVAGPLAEFAKSRGERERIWIVELDERLVGSIAIVAAGDAQAQLRWLLLDPDARGQGLGKRLMEEAVAFCRQRGYASVFLWTVRGLEAAAGLYRTAGFGLTEEYTRQRWGVEVTEQRYELIL